MRGWGEQHQPARVCLYALQMCLDAVVLHEPLFVRAGLIPEVLDDKPL